MDSCNAARHLQNILLGEKPQKLWELARVGDARGAIATVIRSRGADRAVVQHVPSHTKSEDASAGRATWARASGNNRSLALATAGAKVAKRREALLGYLGQSRGILVSVA
eukprot:4488568-Alexandrium_andersonii.AAC.2